MSEKNGSPSESDLLDELRFNSSRGAPAAAALRVRERVNRTIAEGDGSTSHQATAFGGAVSATARRRATWVRSAAISAAALFLAGGVGAAIHAVFAPRARSPEAPAAAPAGQPHINGKEPHAGMSRAGTASGAADEPAASADLVATAGDDTAEPNAGRPIADTLPVQPTVQVQPTVTAERVPLAKVGTAYTPHPGAATPEADTIATAVAALSADPVSPNGASPALKVERALLDRARSAFAAAQYGEAEQALDLHERQFPSGQLAEEREALAVRTLAAHGQMSTARQRAARFAERFPHSLFASAVERAVRAIP
jgi:hypothetical protein